MTKVLLGAPVRDRGWILPRFIEHVKGLDLTGIELDTLFIANDCTDDTVQLLQGAGFNVTEINDLPSKTEGSVRGQYGYSHLANLRNQLVNEFLKTDCEYLLSVDTDILLPQNGIRKLVENGLDVCSMILCNQGDRPIGTRAHNIMRLMRGTGYYEHIRTWREGDIIEVDLTGAVYLIHRRVLEACIRYDYHPQGEDIPFCRHAQQVGFKLFCDTSLKPVHVMAPGVELVGGCTETTHRDERGEM